MTAIAVMFVYAIYVGLIFTGIGLVALPIMWIIDAISVQQSVRSDNTKRQQMREAVVAAG